MSTNLTIDDFDPLIAYSNYDEWTTPDPQDHADWFEADPATTGVVWHEATYHYTTVQGAQASFNFTGPSVWIYGFASSPNYTISIDPSSSQPYTVSLSNANTTANERALLFSTEELTYAAHEVVLQNDGGGLGLDLVVVGFEAGGDGATLTNTTLDDRSSEIAYTGTWTQQNNDLFNNSTSTYTEGPGNYFEVNFTGSAVYVFGDQVNDHGPFSVYINDTTTPYATHTGRSGCGGGYAKYCEKLHGLAFFANNLPPGQHLLRLENQGPSEGNMTFFDFDYLVYTTPSVYSSQTLETASCPFSNCTTSTSAGASTSATPTATGSSSSSSSNPSSSTGSGDARAVSVSGNAVLVTMLGCWLLRKVL